MLDKIILMLGFLVLDAGNCLRDIGGGIIADKTPQMEIIEVAEPQTDEETADAKTAINPETDI